MKPTIWHGCYDKSLKGFITDQSFGHPAKYSLGLIERIFDHCIKQGYLSRGDVVGDCFGGVCIGGLVAAYRGLTWIGCELEPKFFRMAGGWDCCGATKKDWLRFQHRWTRLKQFAALCPQCQQGLIYMPDSGRIPFQEPHRFVGNFDLHKSKFKALGVTPPRITQGDSRKFHVLIGGTDAMVSSPPYVESIHKAGNKNWVEQPTDTQAKHGNKGYSGQLHKAGDGYGETSGQIAALNSGQVEAVISSPPYAVISTGAGGLNTKPAKHEGQQSGRSANAASQDTDQKYGTAEGQIARLKGGSVDGIVSSPPFRDGRSDTTKARATKGGGPCAERLHSVQAGTTYGESDGQIDNLKTGDVDAVVTSPPWESNSEGGVKASKFNYTLADTKGHGSTPAAKKRAMERDEQKVYGDSEGQIGKEKGETYWQAMDQVYRSCFQAIKPGGVIVLVVKDYCKGGKRVRLCDDTMRLLEHIRFTPLERIHAMLVSETVDAGLFGEERTKRQRKSFFRRLYEAGIPEGDERRIDHEEVLIARKPL